MGALSLVSVLVVPLSVCGARVAELIACVYVGGQKGKPSRWWRHAVAVVTALRCSSLRQGPFMFSHCEPPNLYGYHTVFCCCG